MRPIAIWSPAEVDGAPAFVRPPPGPFGDHWADRRVIPLRSPAPRRVVLLGESAAAGYLLAPHLTPAKALQALLGPAVDVVDLARTNERLGGLVATAEAALQLAPDVIVVFAGNNWNLLETPRMSPFFPEEEARRGYAAALEVGGLLGPAQAAWSALAGAARRALARLAGLGPRLVVVVPEVNLLDWPARQPAPWLPGEGTAAWHRALAAGDAEATLRLDGGSTPTGFALLGRRLMAAGDTARAEVALRAAADSDRYASMACLSAPRAGPSVQALLRSAAGAEVVDLPAIFRAATGALPGRRLFLDYCHLTPEGVWLAAAAIAGQLGWGQPGARAVLSPEAAVAACVGAAAHGVHRGLEGPLVGWWLERALAVDEGLARAAIEDWVAARLGAAPAVLSPGQLRGVGRTPQHGWRWPGLDAALLDAAQGLGFAADGPPRAELWTPLEGFYPDALIFDDLPRRAAARAAWPESGIAVVGAAEAVEVVLRTPWAGKVSAWMDGVRLGEWAATAGWSRVRVRLPVGSGVRRLAVRWPMVEGPGEERVEEAIGRLRRGLEGPVHPVFGEIFSVRVGPFR